MSSSARLEDNASERRENEHNKLPPEVEEKLRKLRFQNYTPRAESLKPYYDDGINPDGALQDMAEKYDKLIRSTNTIFMDPALDLDNLIPKKANIQMKKALNQKLQRLNKRTQKSIIEIARKRQIEEGELTGATDVQPQVSSDEEDGQS